MKYNNFAIRGGRFFYKEKESSVRGRRLGVVGEVGFTDPTGVTPLVHARSYGPCPSPSPCPRLCPSPRLGLRPLQCHHRDKFGQDKDQVMGRSFLSHSAPQYFIFKFTCRSGMKSYHCPIVVAWYWLMPDIGGNRVPSLL